MMNLQGRYWGRLDLLSRLTVGLAFQHDMHTIRRRACACDYQFAIVC